MKISILKKVRGHNFLGLVLILITIFFTGTPSRALDPSALPTGGNITSGRGGISRSGTSMTVTQDTDKLIAEWDTFNIGQDASVTFQQPGTSSMALNRILDQNPSEIYGRLSANGQVFLLNSAGLYFSPTAQVDVAGLVASTLDITDADFLSGDYTFTAGASAGSITNEGKINAFENGYIAFISPTITNAGTISATGGTVAMAAGEKVNLDFVGDGLVSYTVDKGAVDALIENKGIIKADGGTVLMTAEAADSLTSAVINNTGIIEARTLKNKGGRILLLADMDTGEVKVGGTLDASAPQGGDGGFIETSAAKVTIMDGLDVTTAAVGGKTGTWLIDPTDFTIAASGGDMTGAQATSFLASTDLEIQSSSGSSGTNGDIFVNDSITWSANKLTFNSFRNTEINAELYGSGSAQLALYYGQGATDGVIGSTTATYTINAPVNLAAGNNFFTKLGSGGTEVTYYVITSLGSEGSTTGTDLQGINDDLYLSGNYVLGANIDASATSSLNGGEGFDPIGGACLSIFDDISSFTGIFDGLGHTISDLSIDRPSTFYVGLFGHVINSSINNVGLINNNIKGYCGVGGLVGWNYGGTISNSYATGVVTGYESHVGGLVGENIDGTVTNSFYDKDTTGQNDDTGKGTPKTTAEMMDLDTFLNAGLDIDDEGGTGKIWRIYDGYTYPLLRSFLTSATAQSSASERTYDGTTSVTNGAYTWSTAVDSNRIYGTASYDLDGKNAGTRTVTMSGLYSDQQGYDISYASGTVTITPKQISVTGISASDKVYDASTTAAIDVSAAQITGGATADDDNKYYTGDDLSLGTADATGSFGDKNIGTNKQVTVTGLTLTGTDKDNYTLTDASGETADITPKDLTATYTGTDKVYDGTTAATVTGSSTDIITGDIVTLSETAAFEDKNVGTDKTVNVNGISISGTDSANYTLVNTTAATTADITPKALTVSGITASDKTYDGTTDATVNTVSVAYNGLVSGDDLSVSASGVFGDKNVGTDKTVTLTSNYSGTDVGNYSITDQATTSADITAKALTVSGITAADKIYDGTTDATVNTGSALYNGLVSGDDLTVSATGVFGDKNVGTDKTVTLTSTYFGTDVSNYSITDQATTTADIIKADLIVTASNDNRIYDGLAYSGGNGVTYAGFVNGEGNSVLEDNLSYGGDSQGAFNPGEYNIIPSGLTSENYNIVFVNGVLTIRETSVRDTIYPTQTPNISGSNTTPLETEPIISGGGILLTVFQRDRNGQLYLVGDFILRYGEDGITLTETAWGPTGALARLISTPGERESASELSVFIDENGVLIISLRDFSGPTEIRGIILIGIKTALKEQDIGPDDIKSVLLVL